MKNAPRELALFLACFLFATLCNAYFTRPSPATMALQQRTTLMADSPFLYGDNPTGMPLQETEASANEAYAKISPPTDEMLFKLTGRPTSSLYEWGRQQWEKLFPSTPLLEPGEANRRYGFEGLIPFEQPVRERIARGLGLAKAQEIERNGMWERYSAAHSLPVRFIVAGTGFLLDPIVLLVVASAVIFVRIKKKSAKSAT